MKKLITTLLALSLLLSGLPALSEGAPMVYHETGLSIDFEDILNASPNYVNFVEYGVMSHDPFMACMYLQYYALPKEVVNELDERFDSLGKEAKNDVMNIFDYSSTVIAYIFNTNAEDPNAAIESVLGELPQDAEIIEFGQFETNRYLAVMMPAVEFSINYDDFAEFGIDPEKVREDPETLRADMDHIRTTFIERLRSAELYAPYDPIADCVGQTLSFETTDVDGNAVTSAELFKDNQITMVNIWGTWCVNCVNEMEQIAEIHTRLQEKGCGVLGVEFERERPIETMVDEIHAFMEEKGVNYPNVIMPLDNPVFNLVSGFPTTFFVDSTGKILIYPIIGARVDMYERTVDQLLAGEKVDMVTDAGAVKNDSGEYRVVVCDRDGNPVEGAVIQLCDDVTCSFQATDANGVATFSVAEQKVYDVHVLMAPEGYAPDEGEYKTLDTFSDVNIFLEKAE